MRKYRFLTPARLDLVEILEYLRANSPIAADRFLQRLEARLNLLADFPKSGHKRSEFDRDELLFITLDPYIIAYHPDTLPISIVAVLHASRDLINDFKTR